MSKIKGRVLLVITIIIVTVIFAHSAMSATDSAQESGSLLDMVLRLFALLHLPLSPTDHSIRKAAHFIEFAVYGLFLSWTIKERRGSFAQNIFMILFFLTIVPLTDETIQYSSPGRSAEVKDVLLDMSGALTGFAATALAFLVLKKRRDKNDSE